VSRWWRSSQSCRYWKYYTMIHIFVWGIAAISLYTSTAAIKLIAVMAFHTPSWKSKNTRGIIITPPLKNQMVQFTHYPTHLQLLQNSIKVLLLNWNVPLLCVGAWEASEPCTYIFLLVAGTGAGVCS